MFRTVTGIVVILFGVWFVYLGATATWIFFVHGFIACGIGVAIICNTREDEIEEINHNKTDHE